MAWAQSIPYDTYQTHNASGAFSSNPDKHTAVARAMDSGAVGRIIKDKLFWISPLIALTATSQYRCNFLIQALSC